MPKLSGVFQSFRDLEKIPATDIARWLKAGKDVGSIENFLANRLLYPQTVPITKWDLEMDFAILKEVILRQSDLFYDLKKGQVTITSEFIDRFPDLYRLVTIIAQSINFSQAVIPIYLKKGSVETIIGSIFTPKLSPGLEELLVSANGHDQLLACGKTYNLSIKEKQAVLKLNKQLEVKVFGGEVGVIIKL